MPGDIPTNTLLVISDTPIQKRGSTYFAFEPVLKEMEALLTVFDNITWLACSQTETGVIMRECTDARIQIVAMPSVNHNSLNAFRNLLNYPTYFMHIIKGLGKAQYVHTRGPSHPALLGVLLSFLDNKRTYWHKYAGNWQSENLSGSYRVQRSLLKTGTKSNVKVTINGNWNEKNTNIFSFENPCITNAESAAAIEAASRKDFSGKLSLIFVGNLNTSKGILNFLKALTLIDKARVDKVFIVGDGPLKQEVEKNVNSIDGIHIQVLGALSREELNEYYKRSHVLVLPSASEGFPKVIAEASAYGCIPIATALSAIPQYVCHLDNGVLLKDNTPATIVAALNTLMTREDLALMSKKATDLSAQFTYERYVERIRNEIFN